MIDGEITTRKIVELLQKQDLPFHLTGGIVSSLYGEPRSTMDVDVVVKIPMEQVGHAKRIVELLEKDFIVELDACLEAIEHGTLFQAIDRETYFKADIHVKGIVPLEFERSVRMEIFDGFIAPVVSVEDAILSKLLWINMGSNRSRQDVVRILQNQHEMDTEYLETTAQQLGVEQILNEMKAIAESNDTNIIF